MNFLKSIQPRMTAFNNPAPRLPLRITLFFSNFFSTLLYMWNVPAEATLHKHRHPRISFVSAKMMSPSLFGHRAFHYDRIKCPRHKFRVMDMRSAHDEGQRDSTRVHQQAALCTFFFPDRSGCCQSLPVPKGLCSSHHRYFAISRQSLPSHRILTAPFAITVRKNQWLATQGSIGVSHSDCRTAPSEALSIVSLSGVRKRCPRISSVPVWVFSHLRLFGHIFSLSFASSPVRRIQSYSRIHLKHPMTAIVCFPWGKYGLFRHKHAILIYG